MESVLYAVIKLGSQLNINHAGSGRVVQTLSLNVSFEYHLN
jgi:hypothetical protein